MGQRGYRIVDPEQASMLGTLSRPRPTREDVIDKVAERLADDLMSHESGADRQGMVSDLAKLLRDHPHEHDGYRLARELEHDGWDPDAYIVELLDGDPAHQDLAQAVRAWVKAEGIRPAFGEGDQVRITLRGVKVQGRVLWVTAAEATYCVHVEGHGLREKQGYVAAFEETEGLEEKGSDEA